MRKLLLLSMLFMSVVSHAQFKTNDRLLSGLFNITTNKADNPPTGVSSSNTFLSGLNISVSKFKSDRRFNSVFLSLNHNVSKQFPFPATENKQTTNVIGAGFTHTRLTPLGERVYLSFPFTIGASLSRSTFKINDQTANKGNGFNAGASFTIGVMYLTKKNWVFSANLGSLAGIRFDNSKTKFTSSESRYNSFNIYGGTLGSAFNNMSIGIGYLLR